MGSLLLDILPLIGSLIMGAITTYMKQSQHDLHMERMYSKETTTAARQDQSIHTSKTRKFIVVVVMGSLCIIPFAIVVMNWLTPFFQTLLFADMPWVVIPQIAIYVPREVMQGGLLSLLWSEEVVEYVPLTGFVIFPIYFMMAQVLLGYYFGATGMRR